MYTSKETLSGEVDREDSIGLFFSPPEHESPGVVPPTNATPPHSLSALQEEEEEEEEFREDDEAAKQKKEEKQKKKEKTKREEEEVVEEEEEKRKKRDFDVEVISDSEESAPEGKSQRQSQRLFCSYSRVSHSPQENERRRRVRVRKGTRVQDMNVEEKLEFLHSQLRRMFATRESDRVITFGLEKDLEELEKMREKDLSRIRSLEKEVNDLKFELKTISRHGGVGKEPNAAVDDDVEVRENREVVIEEEHPRTVHVDLGDEQTPPPPRKTAGGEKESSRKRKKGKPSPGWIPRKKSIVRGEDLDEFLASHQRRTKAINVEEKWKQSPNRNQGNEGKKSAGKNNGTPPDFWHIEVTPPVRS